MIIFDKELIGDLLEQARGNVRLRQNLDLRTTDEDTSQRMMNALVPGTVVPIHRHEDTTETVVCLCGRLDEVIYEEVVSYSTAEGELPRSMEVGDVRREVKFREIDRIHLCPSEGMYGCQIPKGAWHTVEVIEPSVIVEAKDGAYCPK